MTTHLKAPLPYVGGKADVAPEIWSRFGADIGNYVEVFAGSSACLLARPGGAHGTETCNDVDGLLINSYRAIQFDPEQTAQWCDFPVSEADLTSRHLYLKANRAELTARLFADPFYFDPLLAGFFLWGAASWIGDGWCVADGPWINVDGVLTDRRTLGSDDEGVRRKMPLVSQSGYGNNEQGIQKYRAGVPKQMPMVSSRASGGPKDQGVQSYRAGVPRQMPMMGSAPRTQRGKTQGVQSLRYQEGVRRKMPKIMPGPYGTEMASGVNQYRVPDALLAYFARLSARLRRVRFLCGDWHRAVKDSVTVNHGTSGVFIDSPYPKADHSMEYHSGEKEGEEEVWFQSARWAVEHGDDKRLRIAVCGYMSPAADAMFPDTWERYSWEARGGYSNQSKDGRGRANAKREMIFFSPHCLNPGEEAKRAFERPITVKESNYEGTMFDDVNS